MIPRHQTILFIVLLIASIVMGAVLWNLRERAHQRLLKGEVSEPTQAPQVAPAEQATLMVASDADNTVTARVLTLPLPQNPEARARALLGKLFDLYNAPDAAHRVPGGLSSIAQVFLLPVARANVRREDGDTGRSPAMTADPTGQELAVVNLTSGFVSSHPSGIETESLTILSICATLHANFPDVTQVRFLVDGQQRPTLAGHADLTRTYLTEDTVPIGGSPAVTTIGVFDSGFGGLTVLRALMARLPAARFAFLGDTARLPYGSKSRRTIARYAAQSAQFLVNEQGADFLVIACNTASALALDAIKEAVPVPVLGVIEPGAAAARAASQTGDALVIATEATVHSHAYAAACRAQGLRVLEKACPLLVPLVEEGWTDHPVTANVVEIYLDELRKEANGQGMNPDTLVLGCTHYPLLRPLIERAVGPGINAPRPGIKVIDSAESAAEAAVELCACVATAGSAQRETEVHCFATDSVEKFERLGSRFLERPVGHVELVDLGG